MKILNKEQIKFAKSYIVRKQDFPEYMDRDQFINQLSGLDDFRFEYNGEDFFEQLTMAVTLSESNKIKVQRHFDYINHLTYAVKDTDYFELMYNLELLNKYIKVFIDRYNKYKTDELFDELLNELNIKTE